MDGFDVGTNFSTKYVHLIVPDLLFTLNNPTALIFQDNNFFDFNYNGNYKFKSGINTTIATNTESKPIIIRKDSDSFYILFFDKSNLYQYTYIRGMTNLISTASSPKSYSGEQIEKIIPKFGAIFVVTSKNIYIYDNSLNTLNKIDTGNQSEFQFHRDNTGKIYAMPEGLDCQINNSCTQANRIYIDTDCATNGDCAAITAMDSISSSLGTIYKKAKY